MDIKNVTLCFCLLLLWNLSEQQRVEEVLLNSTTERRLEWISQPETAWRETYMKLGLPSAHPVYQGCDPSLKDKTKTLWTKWILKKEAYEPQLDLLFAQDDQVPVTILILESDNPVSYPRSQDKRSEIVSPRSCSGFSRPEDVKSCLYYAQGLQLGKLSKKGFHLGFRYTGSCMFISSVRVFNVMCSQIEANLANFGRASANSGWSVGQCIDGAEEVSPPKMECQSDGEWSQMQGSCVCGAGFQREGNRCKACELGRYKPANDSGECRLCPANSRTNTVGGSVCDCEDGYDRLPNDPPQLGCTKSPSAPRNLTIHHVSNKALIVSWKAPADLGGREEVMYDVQCKQKTAAYHDQWLQCNDSAVITPNSKSLIDTKVNITGLEPHVNYQISVRAYNRITGQLGETGSVQSVTVWKTPVVIPPEIVPEAASKQASSVIAGVLCGVLLLLTLIPAAFCFIRRYSRKLSEDPDVEFVPLQESTRSYRRPAEPQNVQQAPSNQSHSLDPVQVLSGVNEQLLCGIRDVLVDRSKVTLGKQLGKGEFGAVYEGIYSPEEAVNIQVAVKTMRVGIYSQDDLQSFLKEAEIMQHFDHDNVVKLLGVTLETDQDSTIPFPLVLLPFMKHGDLRRFLIATRYGDIPMFVPHQSLLRFMVDIATGMEYLSSKGFLHRDLAARNCMLGDDLRVRVADFGLSKQICSSNYYRQKVAIKMPIKWMAIESLSESIYTTKSDVWSFGVTMWEIVSRGRTPYPGIPNHELLEMLEGGHRLKQGECDSELYEVMLNCWHKEPSQRPCFTELAQILKALLCQLPPLEPSKEDYYINQGLEIANAAQSSAATADPEELKGNIYLPTPVASTSHPKENEELTDDMKDGYLLCNQYAT